LSRTEAVKEYLSGENFIGGQAAIQRARKGEHAKEQGAGTSHRTLQMPELGREIVLRG
jgi:hypothetical protein